MTSPSLRSRRTTRRSTGRRTSVDAAALCRAAGVAVVVAAAVAASASVRADDFAPEPPDFTSVQPTRALVEELQEQAVRVPRPPSGERERAPARGLRSLRNSAAAQEEQADIRPRSRFQWKESTSVNRAALTRGKTPRPATETPTPTATGRAAMARVSRLEVSQAPAEPAAQPPVPQQPPAQDPKYDPSRPAAPGEDLADPFRNGSADGSEGAPYTPAALKRVTAILPFADYEPDPKLAETDPCRNLCPRPGFCEASTEPCPKDLWEAGLFSPRMFDPSCYTWAASNIWYNPLYFEDVQLERYGHTYCPLIQPAVSVGRFGAQIVTLPYHMAIDPPCKKVYALGYYRPGDCAPKLCYQPPLSVRGGLAQAGVMTGLFFVIP